MHHSYDFRTPHQSKPKENISEAVAIEPTLTNPPSTPILVINIYQILLSASKKGREIRLAKNKWHLTITTG